MLWSHLMLLLLDEMAVMGYVTRHPAVVVVVVVVVRVVEEEHLEKAKWPNQDHHC